MMRSVLVCFLMLCFCSALAASEPVNRVAGDQSWFELRDVSVEDASEVERISVHLEWVEAKLRSQSTHTLDPDVAAKRLALLNVLRDYWLAGEFPRHTSTVEEGRAPRWVDDLGIHCAVAHLVAASGRPDLVAAIQRRHQYDYVPDMDSQELLQWAKIHGFTVEELALIQPTYDDGGVEVPTKFEEEDARRRAKEEAKVPRPLTREPLERLLTTYVHRDHARACFGKETGTWKFEATISVGPNVVPVVRVDVTKIATGKRDANRSRCWSRKLQVDARDHLAQKNYTVKETLKAAAETTLTIPTRDQVFDSFLALDIWAKHHKEPPSEALAKCFKNGPEAVTPLRFAIEVQSWNGHVHVDYGYDQTAFGKLPKDVQRRWHCIGDILRYGSVEPRPLYDTRFTIELDPTGSIREI